MSKARNLSKFKPSVDGLVQSDDLIAGITIAGNADTATNADQLDGQHGSYYATASSVTTEISDRIAGDSSALSSANTYTDNKVAALVNTAPATLDTLNELAVALGNDANFSTTVTNSLAGKQATLVSGTNIKTVNGTSILGSGNIQIDGGVTSFNTRTGAVTLSSSDVTSALGYTPYNSTNPNGYITSSALSSYLPLSGGTLNDRLLVNVNGRTTSYTGSNFEVLTGDNTPPGISFHRGGYSATLLYESDGELYTNPWTTRGQTGKLLAAGNYASYAVRQDYNTSLNSDTRNTRGVTRLYRSDDNSDYSVQTYWTGSHWYLQGYNGDSFHAHCRVGYADSAGNGGVTSVNGQTGAVTVNSAQYLGSASTKAIAYNSNTISENITISNGINAYSAGPITVGNGYTITIQDGGVWVVI